MIILYSLMVGLMNALAGRGIVWQGRPLLRCILPGIAAGLLAESWYIWFAVTAGSAFFYPWGWSFQEIHGIADDNKYPKWSQKIADLFGANPYVRGIVMKGIRGGYDIFTFLLLSAVNPWALALYPATLLMGAVYWVAGRIAPRQHCVMVGEFWWGCIRGFLISIAITKGFL